MLLAEKSRQSGVDLAPYHNPYRNGDVREKCAMVAVTTAVRPGPVRPAAGGAIGEKRADHLAHITTRSSSLVTLELIGDDWRGAVGVSGTATLATTSIRRGRRGD